MANPTQIAGSTVTGSGTSRNYTVTSGTSAGDTLLVLISTNGTSCTVSAVTDSQGNTYVSDGSFTSATPLLYGFRSAGASGGPSSTPTVALSTSDHFTVTASGTGNIELIASTAGTVGALDVVSSVASGTSTTPSVSATPTAGGDTCISGFVNGNAGGSPTVNSPFTSVGTWQNGSNAFNTLAYDNVVGGSGSAQTSTLTITSSTWRGIMWTFLAASTPGAAALSGSGSLTAGPKLPSAVAMSGTGSLSGTGNVTGAAALSGSGTLSAAETAGWTAALSGSGTLTAAETIPGAVSLSGSGTLTSGETISRTSALSGSGTLTSGGGFTSAVAMSGSGSLAAGETVGTTAALSGSGTLAASATVLPPASLSGSGTLSAAGTLPVTAALSGSGTLTPGGGFKSASALSGSGTLTSAGNRAGASALAGSGTLTAVPSVVGTLLNSFEGGTNGTAISVANSGGVSGNPWDSLGGSTTLPAYTTANALVGSVGAATPLSGNNTTTLEWRDSFFFGFNSNSVPWYARDYFQITTLPPTIARFMKAQDDLVPVDVWAIAMDTTGHLGIRDILGNAWQGQATTAVSTGTKNRWECSSSYDGTTYSITLRCFYGSNFNGTTPDETVSGSVTSSNPTDLCAFGMQTATNQTWSGIYHDSIALTNVGWPGPDLSKSGAAILSGAGTLGLSGATIGQVLALAGSGTLTSSPKLPSAASLAGAGTLTSSPLFRGAVVLTGQGVLGAALTVLTSVALSGSGTLTSGPLFPGAVPLAGLGTLVAAEKIGWAAALSGSGTLTSAGSQSGNPFATMTGSGTLAISAGIFVAASAMSGSGTLAGLPVFAPAAVMTGAGTLAAAPLLPGAVLLAGSGTLSGSPLLFAAVTLAGAGTLSAVPLRPSAASLAGLGTLAAAGVRTFNAAAVLSGAGTLGGAWMVVIPSGAHLTGSGSLTSAGKIMAAPLALSGAGTLTAAGRVTVHALAAMSGSGTLSSAWIIPVLRSAILSGSGTLTASWTLAPPSADWLWLDYEKKRDKALRLWQFWSEAKSTGDPITAGPAFIKAYQADAAADAAYVLWQQVSGSDRPIQ